jgi:hypothetical protein
MRMDNIMSRGARNVLLYLGKYSFKKGKPTVIDGEGLKAFIEADLALSFMELIERGYIKLHDADSKTKTISVELLDGIDLSLPVNE